MSARTDGTGDQSRHDSDRQPLLRQSDQTTHSVNSQELGASGRSRGALAGGVTFLLVLALAVIWRVFPERISDDPLEAARQMLKRSPVIDGHVDLPLVIRMDFANNVSSFDLRKRMPGHVDIPRLREGHVGGFFWSVYVECKDEGPEFTVPSYRVRDTLEQIDVAKLMIKRYPEVFKFATSSDDIKFAIRKGKIASILGVEGAHQLGNSLGVLRQYHELGVRYVTLTHMCHNAFADSCGEFVMPKPLHGGLSKLGYALITELNRLGVLVDVSHTSDETTAQAMKFSRAPVIWSHSSARALHNVSRNVPDEILRMLAEDDELDGVVMANFVPQYVAPPGKASLEIIADHIDHMGKIAGREHIGLGSDFDGIETVPVGLEDVSKFPQLFAELIKRGWTRQELAGLAGENFLRVYAKAEVVSRQMQQEGVPESMALYGKRPDLPEHWLREHTEA